MNFLITPTLLSTTKETNHSSYFWNIVIVMRVCVCVSPGQIKDVQVPDSVPVDLRAKLIVCLIHLHVSTPLEVNGTNNGDKIVTEIWCRIEKM